MALSSKALNATRVITLVSMCLIFSGCSHESSTSTASGANKLTRADLGPQWPFTVDSVELSCSAMGGTIVKANGAEYAGNDLAMSEKNADGSPKYPSIQDSNIVADDVAHPGKKMDVAPLITGGPQGCKK